MYPPVDSVAPPSETSNNYAANLAVRRLPQRDELPVRRQIPATLQFSTRPVVFVQEEKDD